MPNTLNIQEINQKLIVNEGEARLVIPNPIVEIIAVAEQGPTGPQGPQGIQGPPGISDVDVIDGGNF